MVGRVLRTGLRVVGRERGLSALQAVLILGTGLLILLGVRGAWDAGRDGFEVNVRRGLTGDDSVNTAGQGGSQQQQFNDYRDLVDFAEARGFTVTSTNGGNHNVGSAHYEGRAIDVRTRNKTDAEVEGFIREAQEAGITVRDERTRPPGQKVWSGPHLHLQIPRR